MRWIKQLKLKHQFYVLIVCAMGMIIFLQSISFWGFRTLSNKRAKVNASQLMEQMAYNMNSTAASLKTSSATLSYNRYVQEILVSDDPVRNFELYEFVMDMIKNAKSHNTNIYSIYLLNNDSRKISDPTRDDNGITERLESIYHFKDEEFKQAVFSPIIKGYHENFSYYAYIFPIFSNPHFAGDGSKIGSGLIILDTRELSELVKIKGITENSRFMLLDQNNQVIASNGGLSLGDQYQNVFWNDDNNAEVTMDIEYEGRKCIAQYKLIESTSWKIVSIIPMEELTSDMNPLIMRGILFTILAMIVLGIIGYLITLNVTRPVNEITDFLMQEERVSLKQRLDMPYENEIGIISKSLNQMLDKVETMTRKTVENQTMLYEVKLAEQQAKQLALQSQINPHFLYNTLNCLSSIGLSYDVAEVVDISTAMANIFRYSIKGDDMATVREEIDCIQEYLCIMDIRYRGKFDVTIHVDDSLMDIQTLKMILQPIVENAMYHGLEQKSGRGSLLLEGKLLASGDLEFVVEDNGKGMSEQRLTELREAISDYGQNGLYRNDTHSIGLGNINKRIQLQFGEQYGMQVESVENVGTKVVLLLPGHTPSRK